MIDGLSGLIVIGLVATIGFLMVRAVRRGGAGSTSNPNVGYWSGSDIAGPSASSSPREDRPDADRGESGGWFGGLFGASDSSSSSDSSGGGSSGGGDSGGGGGGGGGD